MLRLKLQLVVRLWVPFKKWHLEGEFTYRTDWNGPPFSPQSILGKKSWLNDVKHQISGMESIYFSYF